MIHLHTRRHPRSLLLAALAMIGTAALPVHALTINPTFDPSINADLSPADAASWHAAIGFADAQIGKLFSDPITINITFTAAPGTQILGQSAYPTPFIGGYDDMKTALAHDAHSADDLISVATLPVVDPSDFSAFCVTPAQGKALGIRAANDPANDGTVTMGAGYSYAYDPAHRAIGGYIDFIGVVEHEITEIMGRAGNYNLGNFGALDLFGYRFGPGGTGIGTLNISPFQANNYFCIDGGLTPLMLNNNASNGEDDKDWAGGTNDSFNAFSSFGVENDISAVDLREMDVIGYDLATPEPASIGLLAAGAIALLARRRSFSQSS